MNATSGHQYPLCVILVEALLALNTLGAPHMSTAGDNVQWHRIYSVTHKKNLHNCQKVAPPLLEKSDKRILFPLLHTLLHF